jgi:hypothetical protein
MLGRIEDLGTQPDEIQSKYPNQFTYQYLTHVRAILVKSICSSCRANGHGTELHSTQHSERTQSPQHDPSSSHGSSDLAEKARWHYKSNYIKRRRIAQKKSTNPRPGASPSLILILLLPPTPLSNPSPSPSCPFSLRRPHPNPHPRTPTTPLPCIPSTNHRTIRLIRPTA